MPRILLSLLTIGMVVALAAGATYAYFQNTTQFANEPSVLSTTGVVNFYAVLTDDAGAQMPFTANLAPGQSITRCLWIQNRGSVGSRFRVYMKPGSETGSLTLGDALRLNAKATPDSGRCTTLPTSLTDIATKYSNFTDTTWSNVPLRSGGFSSLETTPFMNKMDGLAMGAKEYSVWQFDLSLPTSADSSIANKSYTFQGELFAIQDGGTFSATPSPSPF